MATWRKTPLSGSSNGLSILVAQTATPGTTIHTATSTSDGTAYDEVWIWAVNTSASSVKLSLEYGGVTDPNHLVEVTIKPEDGPVLVIPGWPIDNAKVIKAFAATANVLTVYGYVNKLSGQPTS